MLSEFTIFASYFTSSQRQDELSTYTANTMRFGIKGKVGQGILVGWFDNSKFTQDDANPIRDSFVWIHYQYSLYKSKTGEVILKPTVRLLQKKDGDIKTYSRNKFELTTVMKFR